MTSKKPPSPADFPTNLTVTITPPQNPPRAAHPAPPNILLLLHGLGDTAAAFTTFGRALNLPETTVVTIQAPSPLPFDLGGFHWGDDVSFDSATGTLDMDAGFKRATGLLLDEVIRGVLVRKCGYRPAEIMILGFGQGGMAALVAAREMAQSQSGSGSAGGDAAASLAGVISIGAPYPLSGSTVGAKSRTPVLLVGGREPTAVSEGAIRRTKQVFEFVEVHQYARKGDGMPRNREEMMPVMQFFARRLRSWRGVPEGSVEIT
jgi:predicted esterase